MLRAAVIKHYFFKLLARFRIFSIKGQKVVFQGLFGIGFDFVGIARERKIYIAARHADGDTVCGYHSTSVGDYCQLIKVSVDVGINLGLAIGIQTPYPVEDNFSEFQRSFKKAFVEVVVCVIIHILIFTWQVRYGIINATKLFGGKQLMKKTVIGVDYLYKSADEKKEISFR